MKYTIELTENQKKQMDFMLDMANKHMGFNRKLEMIETTNVEDTNEYQIGYKVGLEDGNKIADKDLKEIQDSTYDVAYNKGIDDLTHAMKVYFPLSGRERLDYFGLNIQVDTYATGNPKDLIAKAKAYEEKKKAEEESIKVGDEVYIIDPNDKSVVTFVDEEKRKMVILTIRGKYSILRFCDVHKTGRHFEEVGQLLDKLKGEE